MRLALYVAGLYCSDLPRDTVIKDYLLLIQCCYRRKPKLN